MAPSTEPGMPSIQGRKKKKRLLPISMLIEWGKPDGVRRSQTSDRERNAENGRYLEQVRTDRGAQTRQAGPRDAAEKHHHRHARPCGDRARWRDRRPPYR